MFDDAFLYFLWEISSISFNATTHLALLSAWKGLLLSAQIDLKDFCSYIKETRENWQILCTLSVIC